MKAAIFGMRKKFIDAYPSVMFVMNPMVACPSEWTDFSRIGKFASPRNFPCLQNKSMYTVPRHVLPSESMTCTLNTFGAQPFFFLFSESRVFFFVPHIFQEVRLVSQLRKVLDWRFSVLPKHSLQWRWATSTTTDTTIMTTATTMRLTTKCVLVALLVSRYQSRILANAMDALHYEFQQLQEQ